MKFLVPILSLGVISISIQVNSSPVQPDIDEDGRAIKCKLIIY